MNLNWHPIVTIPKRERVAADALHASGIETFAPRTETKRWTGYVWRDAVEPLFPGYIFARCDLTEDWYKITRTQGIRRFVDFAGVYPVVDEAIIDEIRWRSYDRVEVPAVSPFPALKPKQDVKILTGAFSGQFAAFERVFEKDISGDDRVIVLLNFLGGLREIECRRSDIQAVSY